MQTPTHETPTPLAAGADAGATGGRGWSVALRASACVLAVLIVLQVGGVGRGQQGLSPGAALAMAGVVSSSNEFTLLTADAGSDDVLLVLDGRAETLFAYRVVNQTRLDMVRRWDVKALFTEGKSAGAARPK